MRTYKVKYAFNHLLTKLQPYEMLKRMSGLNRFVCKYGFAQHNSIESWPTQCLIFCFLLQRINHKPRIRLTHAWACDHESYLCSGVPTSISWRVGCVEPMPKAKCLRISAQAIHFSKQLQSGWYILNLLATMHFSGSLIEIREHLLCLLLFPNKLAQQLSKKMF